MVAQTSETRSSGGIVKGLKALLVLALVIVALVLGVWISVDNPQPVSLVLMGFSLPPIAQGVLITGVLMLGAILGFVISLIPTLKITNENLSLRRKVRRRDKELGRLRKAPLKD
ncbi:MAG: hypothetical protein AseanaTS_21650 [Candidatus Pelagadaptatus aseana]|uniref:LapA family protein n=1 Tax=Candidatus Pelagadaptatus aseana TaxID=3120508 RepID=UPI0039B25182